MNIEKICKNVGHDGESYFCMLCGKAGYSTKEQAMGHLAKCKSRTSSLASQPPSQPATTSLAELPTELPTKLPSDMSAIVHLLSVQGQQMAEMKQQYQKVYNEVPHLQAVQQMGFLGIPSNTWVWIVGIGIGLFLVYKLGQESKCHCDNAGSSRRRLGSTLQDKVTDKAISYGISRLFK